MKYHELLVTDRGEIDWPAMRRSYDGSSEWLAMAWAVNATGVVGGRL